MLLRKQKSAGANLSLFPSWFPFYGFVVPFRCLVRFTNVVTSGMVPPSRRWKRGCRDLKWFPLPCRAYVSRKREILQSRPVLSPCNYSHNLSPSQSSDFSISPFWNLLTNFTPRFVHLQIFWYRPPEYSRKIQIQARDWHYKTRRLFAGTTRFQQTKHENAATSISTFDEISRDRAPRLRRNGTPCI